MHAASGCYGAGAIRGKYERSLYTVCGGWKISVIGNWGGVFREKEKDPRSINEGRLTRGMPLKGRNRGSLFSFKIPVGNVLFSSS